MAAWLREPRSACLPESDDGWRELVQTAREHRVVGLLLELCRSHDIQVPVDIYRNMRALAAADAGHAHALKSDLHRILTAFEENGVDVCVLKGLALHLTVYPRLDQRPAGDIDLLVAPSDAEKACRILEEADCEPGQTLLRPDFFPKYYYETEYHSNSMQGARIDLHAYPLRPLRYSRMIEHQEFVAATDVIEFDGLPVRIPRPTVMLIHLAAHAAFHGFERLIWLYDIKCWITQYRNRIDRVELRKLCRRWGLALAVARAFEETENAFGPCGLGELTRTLSAGRIAWQDRLVLHEAPRAAASPARHVMTTWLTTPGWRFANRYLWAATVPGKAHLASVYPFRHWGWEVAAMGYRMIRPLTNLLKKPAPSTSG